MAAEETKPNGRNGYERWVVSELGEIREELTYIRREQLPSLENKLTEARLDIRALQTRAIIGGGAAGTVFGAIVAAIVGRLV